MIRKKIRKKKKIFGSSVNRPPREHSSRNPLQSSTFDKSYKSTWAEKDCNCCSNRIWCLWNCTEDSSMLFPFLAWVSSLLLLLFPQHSPQPQYPVATEQYPLSEQKWRKRKKKS